jgi:hypothetical protein
MLRNFAAAETAATAATTADPTYAKAWSWLGAAKFKLASMEKVSTLTNGPFSSAQAVGLLP